MNIFQKAFYNIRRFFGGFGTSLGSKDFHRYYHDLKKNSLYVENMYNKIATDVAMLNFKHVKITRRKDEHDLMDWRQFSDIQEVLSVSPNEFQTPTLFWSEVMYKILKEGACVVVPTYKKGRIDSLNIVYGGWTVEGKKITFENDDKEVTTNISNVLIFVNPKKNVGTALNSITHLIDENLKQMELKLAESKASLKGFIRFNTKLADNSMKDYAKSRVNNILETAETGGMGYLDKDEEFIELNNTYETISSDEINQLKEQLYQAFGMNERLFTCDYSEEQYRAYFSSVLKVYQRVISEELNRKLFTPTARTQGQKVLVYYDYFDIASLKDLSDFAFKSKYSALMSANEIREIFGYGAYEGGDIYESNRNAISVDEINQSISE